MHVRRALLLFAIVLGLAALATSVSRPQRQGSRPAARAAPEAAPEPDSGLPAEVRLPGPRGGRTVTLRSGEAATLLVSVPEPGDVDLPTLGLSSPAEPLTPARFELLTDEPGAYSVRFAPAEGGESRDFGRLIVR